MGFLKDLFGGKSGSSTGGAPGSGGPAGSTGGLEFDWAAPGDPSEIGNVRAEWNMNNADYADERAMGNGMRLFETGPPQQRFNSAEYMSRGFCNLLTDPDHFDDETVHLAAVRMLTVFDQCPISDQLHAEMAAQRIRLVLTVVKARGWQPPAWGGDGRLGVDMDTPRVRASLAFAAVAPGESLEHFFGRA